MINAPVHQHDLQNAAQVECDGQPQQVGKYANAFGTHHPHHQRSHTVGRQLHHHDRDPQDYLRGRIKEPPHRVGGWPDQQNSDADHDGEEDRWQDLTTGQRGYRVVRNDGQQSINKGSRFTGLLDLSLNGLHRSRIGRLVLDAFARAAKRSPSTIPG